MDLVHKAVMHVKESFPDVRLVVFNRQGQWCYMGDDFYTPDFEGKDIDQAILEDACNSVKEFPFVYELEIEQDEQDKSE